MRNGEPHNQQELGERKMSMLLVKTDTQEDSMTTGHRMVTIESDHHTKA